MEVRTTYCRVLKSGSCAISVGKIGLIDAKRTLDTDSQLFRYQDTVHAQDALVDLGFPMPISTKNGEELPDGIFGLETKKTVADFQSQQAQNCRPTRA